MKTKKGKTLYYPAGLTDGEFELLIKRYQSSFGIFEVRQLLYLECLATKDQRKRAQKIAQER